MPVIRRNHAEPKISHRLLSTTLHPYNHSRSETLRSPSQPNPTNNEIPYAFANDWQTIINFPSPDDLSNEARDNDTVNEEFFRYPSPPPPAKPQAVTSDSHSFVRENLTSISSATNWYKDNPSHHNANDIDSSSSTSSTNSSLKSNPDFQPTKKVKNTTRPRRSQTLQTSQWNAVIAGARKQRARTLSRNARGGYLPKRSVAAGQEQLQSRRETSQTDIGAQTDDEVVDVSNIGLIVIGFVGLLAIIDPGNVLNTVITVLMLVAPFPPFVRRWSLAIPLLMPMEVLAKLEVVVFLIMASWLTTRPWDITEDEVAV